MAIELSEPEALIILRFYAARGKIAFNKTNDELSITGLNDDSQHLLGECLHALGAGSVRCVGEEKIDVISATCFAQKLIAEGITFSGYEDVPSLTVGRDGKKIRYNFDTPAQANTTANQIYLTLHHNENFGLDCINHDGQDHQQYNIYLEGKTQDGAIGNFVYNSTEKPPYIELNSGTTRHKITLEKIVAEAARAHGGTLAQVIEK